MYCVLLHGQWDNGFSSYTRHGCTSALSCIYVILCKQKPSNWPNSLPRQISDYTIGKLQKEDACGFADL